MPLQLQTAPLLTYDCPTLLRLSVAIFFNYMMMSALNRRSCTVARKTEITVLIAKVCNADIR